MGCGGVTIAMEFGIPKEVQDLEMRAGCAICGGRDTGAGASSSDEDFRQADAQVVSSAADVYGQPDVVLNVTRSTDQEYPLFRSEQTSFCFLHLPVESADLIEAREERKIAAIAYSVVQKDDGLQRGLLSMNEFAEHRAPMLAGQLLVSACLPSQVRLVDRGPNGDCCRCNDA